MKSCDAFVLISAEADGEKFAAPYEYTIGGGSAASGAGTKLVGIARDQSASVTVTMQDDIITGDGYFARFAGWSDGGTSLTKTLQYSVGTVILDFHAIYDKIPLLPVVTSVCPESGSICKSYRPVELFWGDVEGADYYRLQYSTDADLVDAVEVVVGESSFQLPLLTVGDYYWRVKGESSERLSLWSEIFEFGLNANEIYAVFDDIVDYPIKGIGHVASGVAVAEFNDDGNTDLYLNYLDTVQLSGHPCWGTVDNKLCLGSGDGWFVDVTLQDEGGLLADAGVSKGIAVADYDNDGMLDIYIANGDVGCTVCPNTLLHNQSSDGALSFTSGAIAPDMGPSTRAEFVDIDNNGLLDLYLGRAGSQDNILYKNLGGYFSESGNGVWVAGCGDMFAFADYNGDRYQDLIVVDRDGITRLLRNNSETSTSGDFEFLDETDWMFREGISGFTTVVENASCYAWGDCDSDGDLDLFVGTTNGSMQLWRNDSDGFREIGSSAGIPASVETDVFEIRAAHWIDFDNDGDLDLSVSATDVHLYRNSAGLFSEISGAVPTPYYEATAEKPAPTTATWLDADNDGVADLYVGYDDTYIPGTYPAVLLRNKMGGQNTWLTIELVGESELSNRDGIGSKVRVVTDTGLEIYRDVGGDFGGLSLGSLDVEIGLGGASRVNLLEVYWPSGRVSQLVDVSVNQKVQVLEEPIDAVGNLYLSLSPSSYLESPLSPVAIGEEFSLYLVLDVDPSTIADESAAGFEAKVVLGDRIEIMGTQYLIEGVNEGDSANEFVYTFNSPVDLTSGPVPLVQYTARIPDEGPDAAASVLPADPCTFDDPVEEASPLWVGGDFGSRYRFDSSWSERSVSIPIIDENPPFMVSATIFSGMQNIIAVTFNEQIDPEAGDGSSATDPEHWAVSQVGVPLNEIPIDFVGNQLGGQLYYVALASSVPSGQTWEISVSGLTDVHSNEIVPQSELLDFDSSAQISMSILRGDTLISAVGERFAGCPQGDGNDELVIEIDFDDAEMAGVTEVIPGDIQLDLAGTGFEFCEDPYNDSPGTAENGYTVTLRRKNVIGCSVCQDVECADHEDFARRILVTWQGENIGWTPELAATSLDVTGDRVIDLADIGRVSAEWNTSPGDPGYTGCVDFVPDNIINVADIGEFASHMGHSCGGAKSALGGEEYLLSNGHVVLVPEDDTGTSTEVEYSVYLEAGEGEILLAYHLGFETLVPGTSVAAWEPSSSVGTHSVFRYSNDDSGRLGYVTGVCNQATTVNLGTLVLDLGVDTVSDDALAIALGDGSILTDGGAVKSLSPDRVGEAPRATATGVVGVFPNPFNPSTTIEYTVAAASHVSIRVYDVGGGLVKILLDEDQGPSAGSRKVHWHGANSAGQRVSSGVYFWRFVADGEVQTGRMLLIK